MRRVLVIIAACALASAVLAPAANAASTYVYQSTVVFDGCGTTQGLAVEPSGGDVWMTRCDGEYANEGPGVFTRYAVGQLNQPSGITLDGSGNVYVADRGNSRVKVFSPAGALTANWLVGGQPRNLDVDASGNVYVTDTTNNKVKKYTSSGGLIGSWGTFGAGPGQFDIPQGIAVDRSSGNVYVADTHNGRIQKFDSNGNYLAQWATGAAGTGLEVDGAGNVYGIGGAGAPVEKFSSSGVPLDTIGAYGTASDQINNPADVAVDAAGIVYVLDAAGKVVRFVQGGRVNVSLDVTPGFYDNFPFVASGGLFPASFTIIDCNDGSCSSTKSTAGPAGSGYSLTQNLPAGLGAGERHLR